MLIEGNARAWLRVPVGPSSRLRIALAAFCAVATYTLVFAGAALAAHAPEVSSPGVERTSPVSTVLTTLVKTDGLNTECVAEWGLTAEYGSTAPCYPGPGFGEFSERKATIGHLTQSTTYHFRFRVTSSAGTGYGPDEAFTTPAPTDLAPIQLLQEKATLVGESGGPGADLSSCSFEYGPTAEYGASIPCNENERDFGNLSGLPPATTFHYRVVVTFRDRGQGAEVLEEDAGTAYGNDVTFNTLAPAPTFGVCTRVGKPNHGEFDKACLDLVPASPKAEYRWQEGAAASGVTLALEGKPLVIEAGAGARITCTGATGAGSVAGGKHLGGLTLVLTGCAGSGAGLSGACSSAGAAAGEVVSDALEGTLGQLPKGGGLEIAPAGHFGPLLEAECAGTTVSLEGGVIAPVKVDKPAASQKLKLKGRKGVQNPASFKEGGPVGLSTSVGGGMGSPSIVKATLLLTNEEAVEVNNNL